MAGMDEHFRVSSRSSMYMERCGRGFELGPALPQKLCFTATDLEFLVGLLYELSLSAHCYYVKFSRFPRDGMYLGRCFLNNEAVLGQLWRRYKVHPKVMCSIQDDSAVEAMRAVDSALHESGGTPTPTPIPAAISSPTPIPRS